MHLLPTHADGHPSRSAPPVAAVGRQRCRSGCRGYAVGGGGERGSATASRRGPPRRPDPHRCRCAAAGITCAATEPNRADRHGAPRRGPARRLRPRPDCPPARDAGTTHAARPPDPALAPTSAPVCPPADPPADPPAGPSVFPPAPLPPSRLPVCLFSRPPPSRPCPSLPALPTVSTTHGRPRPTSPTRESRHVAFDRPFLLFSVFVMHRFLLSSALLPIPPPFLVCGNGQRKAGWGDGARMRARGGGTVRLAGQGVTGRARGRAGRWCPRRTARARAIRRGRAGAGGASTPRCRRWRGGPSLCAPQPPCGRDPPASPTAPVPAPALGGCGRAPSRRHRPPRRASRVSAAADVARRPARGGASRWQASRALVRARRRVARRCVRGVPVTAGIDVALCGASWGMPPRARVGSAAELMIETGG